MIASASLDTGMQVAAAFFSLTLLMAFCWGLLFGFVKFMKRMLG